MSDKKIDTDARERINDEALSALLDGEASEFELRRLLAANEPATSAKWARLNAAQAIVHGQGSTLHRLSPDFAARVMAQLSDADSETGREPAGALDAPRDAGEQFGLVSGSMGGVLGSGWAQGAAKLAIAASVAVAFVVALQSPTAINEPPTAAVATSPSIQEVAAPQRGAVDEAAQQRLREFIASMRVDADEPMQFEQLQDSPLYRLVSDKRLINETLDLKSLRRQDD